MPPLGGGGIFQLIAANGRQDRMILANELLELRINEMQQMRRDRLSGKQGRHICNCCGRFTDNTFDNPSLAIFCTPCRMIIVRLLIRAKGKFKREFPHANIMVFNKHHITNEIKIGAYDADEATAVAREILRCMGFKYQGDVLCDHSKYIQLVAIGEPVTHRNKFGDCKAPHTYIVTLQFDIKSIMQVDTTCSDSSLCKLALAVINKHPAAYAGFEYLPNELLEPVIYQHPELAIRFLDCEN